MDNQHGRSIFTEYATFRTMPITPVVSSAVPLAGPSAGGTLVRLLGDDLAFGSSSGVYQCRFGEQIVPATQGVEAALPDARPQLGSVAVPAAADVH